MSIKVGKIKRKIYSGLIIIIIVYSVGISSLSKELYAGYSNQQLVAWVKPHHDVQKEDQDFEHLGLESYYRK